MNPQHLSVTRAQRSSLLSHACHCFVITFCNHMSSLLAHELSESRGYVIHHGSPPLPSTRFSKHQMDIGQSKMKPGFLFFCLSVSTHLYPRFNRLSGLKSSDPLMGSSFRDPKIYHLHMKGQLPHSLGRPYFHLKY